MYLSSQAEDLLHQLLSLRRLLKEQLHNSSQQSELDLQQKTDIKISIEATKII